MIVRPTMQSDLELIPNIDGGTFIYSMWEGYLHEERTTAFVEYLSNRGLTVHYLHTSGHADVETLKRMVDAINPKNLVPIHTFEADSYKKIFTNDYVRQVKDKEIVEI